MESPVKKLDFNPADKENQPIDESAVAGAGEMVAHKPAPIEEVKKVEEAPKAAVAPGIKPEEQDEPLLQENPQRFVLFPIKYHEVCDASRRVKWPPRRDTMADTIPRTDLADVQEGRGLFLDGRGD